MPGSFSRVIKEYLAVVESLAEGGQIAESTRYRRKLELELLGSSLGHLAVDQIRPSLIQAFFDGLSDFPAKQATAKEAIKALEKWALVRDKLASPITTGTETLGVDGGHEPWSEEEIETAINHARPDLARVVALAINTGQRGSDIVKMRWSDIEEESGRTGVNVTQKKTGKRLWIPFTSDFTIGMAQWGKRAPFFLVLAPDGRPYTRNRLSHEWTAERDNNPRLIAHKGRGLVLHGLRGAAVVRLRKLGFTDLEISSFIGMSPPMVARYSRLADQKKMALATVERLENFRNSKSNACRNKPLKYKDPTH